MLKYILGFCSVFCLFTSCKPVNFTKVSHQPTTQQISLGTIGLAKDFILQSAYNNAAIPNYSKPIKLALTVEYFNKQSYKFFEKAKALQSANISIHYVDSVAEKPKYIKLKIADKVVLIDALNSTDNTTVKNYLKHNVSANVLTEISMALNSEDLKKVIDSDAMFLVEKTPKTYVLQLYKNGAKTEALHFNQGVVFAYKGSNCCWKENKRHRIDITDLVTQFNNCPNKTYRSAHRAEKNISSLKY